MSRTAMPPFLRLAAVSLGVILLLLAPQGWTQKSGFKGPPTGSAKLLFSSGFEDSTALSGPSDCYGTGCWQNIAGMDRSTGFSWPPNVWGGGRTRFQLLADARVDAGTIGNYMVNQIQTVTGHDGKPTRALYSEIKRSGCCGTGSQGSRPTQNPLMLQPVGETSDLYIRYRLKYQPDLAKILVPPNWRVVFEFKTAGDYRVIASVVTWGIGAPLSWHIIGDNEANGGLKYQKFWEAYNTNIPIPIGQWFKFEVFWHRSSGSDGRVWMAVNDRMIVDRYGPNKAIPDPKGITAFPDSPRPIDRIMVSQLYSESAYPIYQWVDDLQIWDGFPPDAAPH